MRSVEELLWILRNTPGIKSLEVYVQEYEALLAYTQFLAYDPHRLPDLHDAYKRGPVTLCGVALHVITHRVTKMVVGSQRTDWDHDMEFVDGAWETRQQVVCERCGQRYRGGHHWLAQCKKLFTDERVTQWRIHRV